MTAPTPSKERFSFIFQSVFDVVILPPYNAVYIYFSPLQLKNKPHEGATSSVFIPGPAHVVANKKYLKM
jgi:hypothetical protein